MSYSAENPYRSGLGSFAAMAAGGDGLGGQSR